MDNNSWCSIETAPKDIKVDLFVESWMPGHPGFRVTDCKYIEGEWCRYNERCDEWVSVEQIKPLNDGRTWRATHWRLPPAAPEGAQT